jgi:hypothetical protein
MKKVYSFVLFYMISMSEVERKRSKENGKFRCKKIFLNPLYLSPTHTHTHTQVLKTKAIVNFSKDNK